VTLTALLTWLAEEPGFARLRDLAAEPELAPATIGVPAGLRPAAAAALAQHRTTVIVTATGRDAQSMADGAAAFLPRDQIAVFPSWETLPHERLSPRADTLARRIAVLRRLAHPDPDGPHGPIRLLLLPVRALIQPVVADLGALPPVTAVLHERVDLATLASGLAAYDYTRTDMVERRGEFAVRGGILDVFPPTEDRPVRIDLWGDVVEDIRYFAVTDQRSSDPAPHGLWAPPCRELLLTEQVRDRAAALVTQVPGAAEILTHAAAGIAVEGLEALTPLLARTMADLADLFPADTVVVLDNPERLRRRAEDLHATAAEFLTAAWSGAAAGAKAPVDLGDSGYRALPEVLDKITALGLGPWGFSPFGGDLLIDARDGETAGEGLEASVRRLGQRAREGWRTVLLAEGRGPARRLAEQLAQADIPARVVEELPKKAPHGVVLVAVAQGSGAIVPGLKIAIASQAELTGRAGSGTREMRAMPSRRRRHEVDPLTLKVGDLVVHDQHGIGRFVELIERTIGSGASTARREYVVVEYAPSRRGFPGDRLFVPTDSLDLLTRYVGGESPPLSKMGGADWSKAKGRARKAVKEIAAELIRLYSARQASPGHAFGPDSPWQRELEDAFEYAETPDQLQTIDEVKADMEKPVPMDRLICGDVGYGKTEIAVRAAFKAVQEGKQVAVLVPTTLLVQQHMETFSERYAPFPVVVKPLSRFQGAAEQHETKKDLAAGKVDVVIGTHALITGQIVFKDLGLVIIDEEQRFGVEHKETLKALRTDVDVLSMSATPIPRTLEMAVSGIREMSTLATPPEERHPVLTYVGRWDERQVVAAIRRELLRDGQVFYVHNRVRSINTVAARLADLLPQARIAIAHGSMAEHALEKVIIDFWDKKYDVLVCTTIIETGLDVANANTLIVDRAERMGLAQLHQLRGRVGRARERAYAYFFYPGDPPLTETAHERLSTIASQSELGAGMAVAMKDLEIRGAGNLLGDEQSGHIEGVGFDLYLRMVSEAVAEARGDAPRPEAEVKVELPVDAHIPRAYIEGDRLRLEAYAKLASAMNDDELTLAREELTDRFGAIPEPVENLFEVARLRNVARAAGITEITGQGRFVRFFPVELPESRTLRLARLYRGSVIKPTVRSVLVPLPVGKKLGGDALRDGALLRWAALLVSDVLARDVLAGSPAGGVRQR